MSISTLALDTRVSMKHGGGGRATRSLIGELLVRGFDEPEQGFGLSALDDGAAIPIGDGQWLIVTTDSHVIKPIGGRWRGIAHIPNGNLRLRDEWAHVDARRRFQIDLTLLWDYAPPQLAADCICGDVMA